MDLKNLHGWGAPKESSEFYLEWCERYLNDDELFKTFKSNPDYHNTFDVEPKHGRIYKDIVETQYEFDRTEYLDLLKKFQENDHFGNPKLYDYDGYMFSPLTLRYIKDSFFIKSKIKNASINKILEVGSGYGGLCKTLDVILDFDEYYFVDLEPAVKMQQKYLSKFDCLKSKKLTFIPANKLKKVDNIDLFISNYSLSECSFETQMSYFDKYIVNSKYLHIIYNNHITYNTHLDFEKFIDKLSPLFDIELSNDFHNKVIFAKRK